MLQPLRKQSQSPQKAHCGQIGKYYMWREGKRGRLCYREGKEERILLMGLRAELKGSSVWRRNPEGWSHVEEP